MARINSNIPALIAQSNLARANQDLETRLQRLSTGLQINRGADNPAGLIASERLRSEIQGSEQAVANSERAASVIATAEGALSEVSALLNSIKALVVEAANTGGISEAEREANQLQIDSAIDSITRISNATNFGGLRLLDGTLDYILSGVDGAAIEKSIINGVNFASQSQVQVDINVLQSAQTANLYFRADSGNFLSNSTIEIAGPNGVQVVEILSGTNLSVVANAINSFKEATGVSAVLINPSDQTSGLRFSSVGHGSDQFVSVKRLQAPPSSTFFNTFELVDNASVPAAFSFSDATTLASLSSSSRDEGRDVVGTINGALGTGDGINLGVQDAASLSLELTLDQDFATTVGSTTTFYITGGGALYQLGGVVTSTQQANIGIQSIAASRLGGTLIDGDVEFLASLRSGGANELRSRNFKSASDILETAIDEVSTLRGRLGAFERNTLQTNIRSLEISIENLTASESRIRDADFAAETAALSRAQILASTATSSLGLAQQQPQQVLQLLG